MTKYPFKKKIGLTPFEWKILTVIAGIPIGETRSYRWVAQRAGKPKAFRAVGQALKKNPFPFIIPCHRVIQSDGSPGGYAGGRPLKKKLLLLEKEIVKKMKETKGL